MDSHDCPHEELERRTIAAHRAYIDALLAWESTIRAAASPDADEASHHDHECRCASAKAEKERRRIAFRELCEELGYVPSWHGIGLPPEEPASSETRAMD